MEDFVMIPLSVFKLPSELLHVYCAVRSFDWRKDGEDRAGCIASAKTIAERIGKGERQTRENLARLAACGAIRMERDKGEAFRILCTPENFDPEKLTPAVHRRPPLPRQSTAGGSGGRLPEGPAADCRRVRRSTADEVDTRSRDHKQRQEEETAREDITPAADCRTSVEPLVLSSPEIPQDRTQKAPRKAPRASEPPALPDWMPQAVWDEWLAFRAQKRAPMPDTTVRRQFAQLEAWRAAGHDPVAIVQHSIMQGYTGLFEPKGKPRGGRWMAQPNRPTAREDQEFTEADLDRLLEESK